MKFILKEESYFLNVLEDKDISALDLYIYFDDVIRNSKDKRLIFYAHFVLEYLACRQKFKTELKDNGIKLETYYHYNQLFNEEFREFHGEIQKFLGHLPHVCRIIRPWTDNEKGIIISNFIGGDSRYNHQVNNSWPKIKRDFFKDNYYIFNHSCCRHIHHIEPIEDIDLLLVSDRWKMDKFNEQNPYVNCTVLSDAFFVKDYLFKPKETEKIYDVVYITRFDECKRNDLLLESLAKLDRKISCLLIFAKYNFDKNIERQIRYLIKKNNLNITIKVELSREELIKEIDRSKISVNFSIGSIDRSVTEILSMDLPIIYLKDNPCGNDIINRQTGLLVESSPDKIAESIVYLLKNKDKFSPRRWILDNCNEKLSNERLKQKIKELGYGSTENVQYLPGEPDGSCVATYL